MGTAIFRAKRKKKPQGHGGFKGSSSQGIELKLEQNSVYRCTPWQIHRYKMQFQYCQHTKSTAGGQSSTCAAAAFSGTIPGMVRVQNLPRLIAFCGRYFWITVQISMLMLGSLGCEHTHWQLSFEHQIKYRGSRNGDFDGLINGDFHGLNKYRFSWVQ